MLKISNYIVSKLKTSILGNKHSMWVKNMFMSHFELRCECHFRDVRLK